MRMGASERERKHNIRNDNTGTTADGTVMKGELEEIKNNREIAFFFGCPSQSPDFRGLLTHI
jgi:hypothetical protein